MTLTFEDLQSELRLRASLSVLPRKLGGVFAQRHERVFVAVQEESGDAGLRYHADARDGIQGVVAVGEFLRRHAIGGRGFVQLRVAAQVEDRVDAREPGDARRVGDRPTAHRQPAATAPEQARFHREAAPLRQLLIQRVKGLTALRISVGLTHIHADHGHPGSEELLVHPALRLVGQIRQRRRVENPRLRLRAQIFRRHIDKRRTSRDREIFRAGQSQPGSGMECGERCEVQRGERQKEGFQNDWRQGFGAGSVGSPLSQPSETKNLSSSASVSVNHGCPAASRLKKPWPAPG